MPLSVRNSFDDERHGLRSSLLPGEMRSRIKVIKSVSRLHNVSISTDPTLENSLQAQSSLALYQTPRQSSHGLHTPTTIFTQPSHIFCILDLMIDHIILHRKQEFEVAFITMLVLFVLASGCIAFSTILFYNALTTLLTKLYNNLTAMLQLSRLLATNEEKAILRQTKPL